MALWQVRIGDELRLARGPADAGPRELLDAALSLDGLLAQDGDALSAALDGPAEATIPDTARVAAPVGGQVVWAAGVTYVRSRDARMEESGTPDHYDRVYEANRPELFFKALGAHVRGPDEPVGVRSDSTWDVPEPELALVVDRSGQIVAYTIGNDVSSRSIEGENPLYLPQAKVYRGSCALGPCLVPPTEAPSLADMVIALRIHRDGAELYHDTVKVTDMRRTVEELVDWLYRAQDFPVGCVLLTGTATVPPPDLTLRPGDTVAISINGLGELRNVVETIHAE